jgi:hypothetical protein
MEPVEHKSTAMTVRQQPVNKDIRSILSDPVTVRGKSGNTALKKRQNYV